MYGGVRFLFMFPVSVGNSFFLFRAGRVSWLRTVDQRCAFQKGGYVYCIYILQAYMYLPFGTSPQNANGSRVCCLSVLVDKTSPPRYNAEVGVPRTSVRFSIVTFATRQSGGRAPKSASVLVLRGDIIKRHSCSRDECLVTFRGLGKEAPRPECRYTRSTVSSATARSACSIDEASE